MTQTSPPKEFVGSSSIRSTLHFVLGGWGHKGILVGSALAYWLLYSFSSGILFYYSFDVTPYLRGVPNPYFASNGPYFSGFIWYPNGHLQVNLLYGPTFFSILLSTLFGLNMLVFAYSLHARGSRAGLGLNGLAGFVPALFSGGCCAVPFGAVLISSFVPLAALGTFMYDYVALTNSLFAVLMVLVLLYSIRRVRSCRPRPWETKEVA